MNERKGEWLQTATGKAFYMLDPRPEEICIEDIAHALSHLCRFGGHTKFFYSVAQHSLLVCDLLPQDLKLQGLLHDASEAYLGDMVHPLKVQMPEYRAAERVLESVIASRFGLPDPPHPLVKQMDLTALAIERKSLMGDPPMPWKTTEQVDTYGITIGEATTDCIRNEFIRRFCQLTA